VPTVSNTSPLLNLAIIGKLELVWSQLGRVLVPPAVVDEFRLEESRPGSATLRQAVEEGSISSEPPSDDTLVLRTFDDGLVQEVNKWASDRTDGKIREVIREVPRRGVVLANATYFFGEWSAPFDEENTKPMPFISPAGGGDPDTIQVPTMSRKTKYPYVEQEIDGQERPLQGVRVPYGETGRLAMYVFVPPDLNEFIRELGPERWDKFTGAMDSVEVKLKLPKFTLRKTADLKPSLRRLGVEKAFTPAANFRPVFNIGTEAGADSLLDGQLGPLSLSEVISRSTRRGRRLRQ